jgi:hypothetical protein
MRRSVPPLLQYAFMAWCLVKRNHSHFTNMSQLAVVSTRPTENWPLTSSLVLKCLMLGTLPPLSSYAFLHCFCVRETKPMNRNWAEAIKLCYPELNAQNCLLRVKNFQHFWANPQNTGRGRGAGCPLLSTTAICCDEGSFEVMFIDLHVLETHVMWIPVTTAWRVLAL